MGYLGYKPADKPLTSADITDGIITGNDIASTFNLTGKTVTLPAGTGGKVLQVVQTVKTDTFSYTGSGTDSPETFSDITGMSLSITPSSASNKILIMFTVLGASQNDTFISIFRNSTNLASPSSPGNKVPGFVGDYNNIRNDSMTITCSSQYLDSPATTSAITYKLACTIWGAQTFYVNRSINDINDGYQIRAVSTITAIEIAA
jgi:hypothetical protein